VRTAFIESLCAVAAADARVFLVCGDLGYSVLERFAKRFPDRYLNAGVAEQNMIGVAAGLALTGHIVFVYSIVNFPVMRCLEQVRNDVAYHRLNVKVVTVGGGLVYGGHGYTHHGAEDLAAMRMLPNMTVVAPGDPIETRLAVPAVAAHDGPCYLRLGRGGEPIIHAVAPVFALGKAIHVRDGKDLVIATTGGTLGLAVQAADALKSRGISTTVLSMPTLQPFDAPALLTAIKTTGRLLTVEEHGWGGLGTAAAEVIASEGLAVRFRMLRMRREPVDVAGSHEYLRGLHGISLDGILAAAEGLCSPS
jgi:transketolase